ncbi:SPW repeat protein [Marivirga sp. S37H4]|uniref:SPW repeat protein n=1 Tax=Marivirga aurantiaca TaxID=2802615 RepID=A0A934WW85_9BACT|nr:SPW repeat protein [Marivirga aurantiaca]MBK6264082.1 SPW repeat protein [Marivirga aurantiaca]
MKIISRKTHGYLDYSIGILLIAAPWIFNFENTGSASTIPIVLGVGTVIYSLITNYELGAVKAIEMKTHLFIDFLAGAFLAVSPWLFNFADIVFWPHVVFGLGEMIVALMTDASPRKQFEGNKRSY